MSTTMHTKGPWRTYKLGARWIIATPTPWAYSAVGLLAKDDGTEEANARLIAASPDLLAEAREDLKAFQCFLEYLRKHADKLPPMTTSTVEVRIEKLRAAIALASPSSN